MILPEPEGRPVWEPAVIALFLAVLLAADGPEMLEVIGGRARVTEMARDWLEIAVAVMLAWGLVRAAIKAVAWRPGADDA